jgi:hypothetical protein
MKKANKVNKVNISGGDCCLLRSKNWWIRFSKSGLSVSEQSESGTAFRATIASLHPVSRI